VFAHLRQGSVAVKPGQKVKAGTPIGAMGMSGDAFLVHLHYQLQSGPEFEEGLPAYFENVQVDTGQGWSAPFTGGIDSGDRVRFAPPTP
jgi:murein DD-endopeptidase MepM/ murein hydrolase activator NlpD